MNKYIEVLCKQNPKISFPCGNPECKKEHTFKSKDVFKNKTYTFECTTCGNTTELDTTKFCQGFYFAIKENGCYCKIVSKSKLNVHIYSAEISS